MHENTSDVACGCGAEYERVLVTLPIKDVGIFECRDCGAPVERWHGKDVPRFKYLGAQPAAQRHAG